MVTRAQLRLRMLDRLGDLQMQVWAGRPTNSDYNRGRTFRDSIAAPTFQLFRAVCYVCGLSAKEAEHRGTKLTTAHIVYPGEPYEEVVDPDNLSRSDVVLLCWADHQIFDALTDNRPFDSIEAMRRFSVDTLDRMRVGRRTGEDLPVEQ